MADLPFTQDHALFFEMLFLFLTPCFLQPSEVYGLGLWVQFCVCKKWSLGSVLLDARSDLLEFVLYEN